MAQSDLTDFEWSIIQPLLSTKVRGVSREDDRRMLNGIIWRLRTGAPWASKAFPALDRIMWWKRWSR